MLSIKADMAARQRCIVLVQFVAALALARPVAGHACDRARSRVARKILDAELYSKVLPRESLPLNRTPPLPA